MSHLVVFVVPFYRVSAVEFLYPIMEMSGVQLAVITQDYSHNYPTHFRDHLPIEHVDDVTSADHLLGAARRLERRYGRIHRILAINEQIQIPVALVRDVLEIEGMTVDAITRFRDKAKMKEAFQKAGVPCARHVAARNEKEAKKFIDQVGFPVCVKPIDGAAAQATFKVETLKVLEEILEASSPTPDRPLQIEEFVQGDEHSCETLTVKGHHLWQSVTHYDPTPLNVVRNPWIQWTVLSPREIDSSAYDDIKQAAQKALTALGMKTGLSHLEWFRRVDGSIAVNEVGARPPGAQICTLINRAHDIDIFEIWSKMMIWDHLDPIPERKYATGAVFLRGLGGSRVKCLEGTEILKELGSMVTDHELPYPGQSASNTYEGEGFVCIRHPETKVVKEALSAITHNVRVRMF